jgi:hypothetical protein
VIRSELMICRRTAARAGSPGALSVVPVTTTPWRFWTMQAWRRSALAAVEGIIPSVPCCATVRVSLAGRSKGGEPVGKVADIAVLDARTRGLVERGVREAYGLSLAEFLDDVKIAGTVLTEDDMRGPPARGRTRRARRAARTAQG